MPQPNSSQRTLALANQKGGVGKTTTAINLGTALAASGKRTLIFDIDPQGNAATGLDIPPSMRNVTSYDVLNGGRPLSAAIMQTKVPNLFIVPGSGDLAGIDAELMASVRPQHRLRDALKAYQSESKEAGFEYMLIDCPPSLNILTVNAMTAADAVLVPLQCEFFALEGLAQFDRDDPHGAGRTQSRARNSRRRADHVRQAQQSFRSGSRGSASVLSGQSLHHDHSAQRAPQRGAVARSSGHHLRPERAGLESLCRVGQGTH